LGQQLGACFRLNLASVWIASVIAAERMVVGGSWMTGQTLIVAGGL
jgi:hypothetical protein